MKTTEELNNMSKEELASKISTLLAEGEVECKQLSKEQLAACVTTLLAENKVVKERADSYYKWYNDQCSATRAVQLKLDSLKALIAVI